MIRTLIIIVVLRHHSLGLIVGDLGVVSGHWLRKNKDKRRRGEYFKVAGGTVASKHLAGDFILG